VTDGVLFSLPRNSDGDELKWGNLTVRCNSSCISFYFLQDCTENKEERRGGSTGGMQRVSPLLFPRISGHSLFWSLLFIMKKETLHNNKE
jgi:hypothetical protein